MCSDSKGIVPLCGALRGRHDGDDVREAAVGADLSSGDVAPYTRATVEYVTLYGGVLGRERLAGQGPARAWRRRGPGRGHGSVRTLRSIADQLSHRDMQARPVCSSGHRKNKCSRVRSRKARERRIIIAGRQLR
jgi:hypothetical protein